MNPGAAPIANLHVEAPPTLRTWCGRRTHQGERKARGWTGSPRAAGSQRRSWSSAPIQPDLIMSYSTRMDWRFSQS